MPGNFNFGGLAVAHLQRHVFVLLLSAPGRPNFLPFFLAASNPALTRSRIKPRSNSASEPKIWKTNLPVGLVVSLGSVGGDQKTKICPL